MGDYEALPSNHYKRALVQKSRAAKSEPESGGGDNAVEHLSKVHPHANGAHKSFHVYQHPDGKLHAHAHDHQAGTHEHQEHVSMHDVAEHMHSHMGEEKAEIRAEREGEMPEEHASGGGGMEQLGM